MLQYQDQILSLLQSYLLREGASHKTTKNYTSDIENFLAWYQATTSANGYHVSSQADILTRLTPTVIDNYSRYLAHEQKSAATITRRCSSIRSLLRAAEEAGIIQKQTIVTTNQIVPPIHPVSNPTPTAPVATKTPAQSTPNMQQRFTEVEAFKNALRSQGIPDDISHKKASHVADFLQWVTNRHIQ